MKYNTHIIKFTIFLCLFCIGFILYKQLNTYHENFDDNIPIQYDKKKKVEIAEKICSDYEFYHLEMYGKYLDSGSWRSGFNSSINTLKKRYPSHAHLFQPLADIIKQYEIFINDTQYKHSDKLAREKTDMKYINEFINTINKITNKLCRFRFKNKKQLIQLMRQLQGLLLRETIDNNIRTQYNEIYNKIDSILSSINSNNLFPGIIKEFIKETLGYTEYIDFNKVTVYTDEYFKGESYKWDKGYWNNSGKKYTVKSFETNGCKLILYSKPDLQGDKQIYEPYTKFPFFKKDPYTLYGSVQIIPPDSDKSKHIKKSINDPYFIRKGISKKIDTWIKLFENKLDISDMLDNQQKNKYMTEMMVLTDTTEYPAVNHVPFFSHFGHLKLVSAGSQHAEQEQQNIPNFDIKDTGGFNLFRAVVTKDGVPTVSSSFSIKDSCMKEKAGIPLEIGTTPLVLDNYARNTSREEDKNRYSSSYYFGETRLYIIKNESDSGKNLNNEYKTYYLSNSGNNTRVSESKLYNNNTDKYNNNTNKTKALYHIRTYNPNTGKFDYAFDVNSNGILQPGKINNTLQTSLYVYKNKGTGFILENYGYRGMGQTAGKPHYFHHSFDENGRETEKLVIDENEATIWTFNEITA